MERTLKILLFSVCLSVIPVCFLRAQDEWVVAAERFAVDTSEADTSAYDSAAALLPGLILAQLEQLEGRLVLPQEAEERYLYDMRRKRLELSLELSGLIRKRDAAVFDAGNAREKEKKRAEFERQIAETEEKLKINIAESDSFAETGRTGEEKLIPVRIWQNDPSRLFSFPENVSAGREEKYASQEQVSAVLRGTVSGRGNFILVTVELILYPGAFSAGKVTDAGSIDSLESLAASVASALVPLLLNRTPARLVFDVPDMYDVSVRFYCDGRLCGEQASVEPGIHTVSVEADGYASVSFSYDFSGGGEYMITVPLEKKEQFSVVLDSSGISGSFFVNAVPAEENRVTVNGGAVLGEFVTDEGVRTFFILDASRSGTASIVPVQQDISKAIEKSRRRMYASFGALLISLPFSFFSWGTYTSAYNGWVLGYREYSDAEKWKNISIGSIAVTAGLGINWLVQLGLYIHTANKVLPQSADIE